MRRRRGRRIEIGNLPWFNTGREGMGSRVLAVVGGCLFAAVATMVLSVLLSLAALAVHSMGALFLVAWIVGAVAIYKALKRGTWRQWGREEGRTIPVYDRSSGDERREHLPGDRREERPEYAGFGDLTLLVMAGIGLVLSAGLILTGRAGASTTNTVLTALLGLLGGGGIAALLRRWSRAATPPDKPSDRQVRAQVKRIRGKCKRLSREAQTAGGVYSDLSWHAPEMSRHAGELADLVLRLRRAVRDTRRQSGNPTLPPDAVPDVSDERLLREYRAAIEAQQRLDALIAGNRRHQRACLAQLERIEDLVDTARLEVATPVPLVPVSTDEPTIIDDVETELAACRRALEEIEQIEA